MTLYPLFIRYKRDTEVQSFEVLSKMYLISYVWWSNLPSNILFSSTCWGIIHSISCFGICRILHFVRIVSIENTNRWGMFYLIVLGISAVFWSSSIEINVFGYYSSYKVLKNWSSMRVSWLCSNGMSTWCFFFNSHFLSVNKYNRSLLLLVSSVY